ncbi:hypothetical protein HYV83_02625 [Candidatus Woesearchaeota archaeon]|nr:hypothetical protein [Candidatus Woesearchaeota archaeon]
MEKGKTASASAAQSRSLLRELAGVADGISKTSALAGLYEKYANSDLRSQAELEEAQREMKVIKSEILSELMRARGILQKLQKEHEA